MKSIKEAQATFQAIEMFQLTQPEKYNELLGQSKICESNSNYKLMCELSELKWKFKSYLETLPDDEFKKIRAITSAIKLTRKCFYDLFLHESKHAFLSQNKQLLVSLINVLKDLESNNKQRLNWVSGELLSKASTFEREFLDILFSSSYNIKTIFEYFNTRFENESSFDLALGSLNEFLKLHLGITTRKAEYDQYDKARLESAQYNSWGKECRNIPPPQNRS
jgi:hypothetical protein